MTQPTQAVQKADKFNTVKDLLAKHKDQIATALPKHLTAEKMIRLATTAISKNPKLLDCTQVSLFGSIMTLAQLGLAPDAVLGEAYLIPYGTDCQLVVGYKGLVSLAHRSGQVARFQARAVYERDEFSYEFGLNESLVHKPCGESDDAKLTHVYAVLEYKDGSKVFDVMTKKEVDFARAKSKGAKNPVWNSHYGEMAKKTIIRRLAKIAPLSPEFSTAVSLDEQLDVSGKSQNNAKQVLNYDIPELRTEAEQSIDTDYEEIIEEEKAEKVAASSAKGESATANAEALLNKKTPKQNA
jgi:recombination protein RecT